MTYEESLAVFSPNGRLIQIEYAQKASDQGSLVTFSIQNNGIFLCIEKKNINPLIVEPENSKFLEICNNIYMSYSGLTPDADILVSQARYISMNYKLRIGDNIDVAKLADLMGNFMQRHTIEGKKRPFGAKILFLGFSNGPRAFIVEPDGNCIEYTAGAIGSKSDEAIKVLEEKNDLNENMAYFAISTFVKDTKGLIQSFWITEACVEKINL
ncbi:Proteasome subunit alpha [Dictyocoela muelleri]|nr:Proteasome subunit alpha [Dictyocoela muelleri]